MTGAGLDRGKASPSYAAAVAFAFCHLLSGVPHLPGPPPAPSYQVSPTYAREVFQPAFGMGLQGVLAR